MLQNPTRIEIMHISLRLELLIHAVDLLVEVIRRHPRAAHALEARVQTHDHNLRFGPHLVQHGNEVVVRLDELRGGQVVVGVAVVGPDVHDDEVGGLVRGEVVWLAVVAVDALGAGRWVEGLVPLVSVAAERFPTRGVCETYSGVGGDGVFDIAETSADVVAWEC